MSEEITEKLHKILARAGIGSRRACEALIEAGRVKVNGLVARVGDRASAADRIEVEGRPLEPPPRPLYLMLHKPPGFLTTMSDPEGRPTVAELVSDVAARVFPVGRLDADAEGLLLMTNDGELANAITHPSHGVRRVYLATVRGTPSERDLDALCNGVMLEDGMTAPAGAEVQEIHGSQSVVRMEIHEGRNRQVKRMCAAIGHPVLRLVRVAMGPLRLARLKLGQWRHLTATEVAALQKASTRPAPRRKAAPRPSAPRKTTRRPS